MARGGWPPNSLAEWVVGQNFRGLTSAPSEGPRPVLRVELSEDEASGGETLSITYPRRRRRDAAAQSTAPAARKVRFHGDRKPLKSALKKSTNPNESSDTLVDTSDDDAEATTDDEYSDFYDSDTSDEDVPIRRRRSTFKKPKGTLCKKETDSDSSAAKDALPHPTCQCVECVKGRKILKAVIKFEAKNGVMGKQSKSTRRRRSQGFDDDTDASDSSANSTDEEASSKNGKNKRQKQKRQQNPSPRRNGQETTKAVNKNAWRMPTYPKEMQPNMIMPPHTKVTQVEHTVETDNDPRPNAFFDSTKGITRVYHGPRYGNHMGELYGKKNTDSLMPPGSAFPPGWQPHNAPWYLPGPPNGPPGSHYAQNMPAMNGQMPFTEAGWIDAASKGIGLSGMPAVLTPPMMREEMRRRESQKAASQKPGSGEAAKSTTWGAAAGANTGWPHLEEGGRGAGNGGNSKAPSPTAANSNNPADAPKADNFGGVGGWGMGDASGSKKDGVSSPFNFDHAANTGEKFERNSNKTGSQKSGNGANGNQDNTWGADKNNGGGDQGTAWNQSAPWGTTEGNGEQKQPSDAPFPSANNGAPANGGDEGWGKKDQNADWFGQNSDWNGNGNGSKKNTPQQHSSFHATQPQAWGGPPASKPPSHHGSPTGGQYGNNGNNNNNNGLGGSLSPQYKGAFAWPPGQASHSGANNDGYGGYGEARPGSRANSHNGGHQGGPMQWQDAGVAQNTGGKAEQW